MADATTDQRLASIEEVLTILQDVIARQTEAIAIQTEMLTALWREVTPEEDPPPSPAAEAIERLRSVITNRLDQLETAVQAVTRRQASPAE
jgi:hypothetical protein